ncbi:MAG: outer membrane protein transport protein [Myxococcales bacterium]|nr:outer membrane protein transport protein [Myxococcales bacterium]
MSRLSLATAVAAVLLPSLATAGGMYLPTRGVRATGRAGAFVAGADDASAMWFNPAGLANLRRWGVVADAGFVHQSADYARTNSGGGAEPSVSNQAPGLPVPSLAYVHRVNDKVIVGGGVWAPYAGLAKFDAEGPQRYSSVDMSKSIIATLGFGVAVRVGERLRLGATLQNHVVALTSDIVLSGCPGQTVCAPEDPEFDSLNRIEQQSYFQPSGSVGLQLDATDKVTFGAAFQLPVSVSGQGTLSSRLPSSGFFNGASVEGDRADVSMTLPAAIRAGVEVRPGRWRIEAALDVELWSAHEEILIEPKDVRIVGAPGVGTYEFGPIHLPRNFDDTYAVQLGVEGQPSASTPLTVRAGYSYETAASPTEYLSVLTVDGAKHLVAGGLGYRVGGWNVDLVFAFATMGERHVDPSVGVAPQVNPIRDTSATPLEVFVNWGDYKSTWIVAGLGLARSM